MILLDLMMPVMDGFEFLRELRGNEDWREIPVIVVTARDVSPAEQRMLREQATSVLKKGETSVEDIVDQVRACTSRESADRMAGL